MRTRTAAAGRPPARQHQLLSLLLLLGSAARCSALSCVGDGSGIGTTYPKHDLNLRPNTQFTLKCEIDPTHPNVTGYTSDDIYFTRTEVLPDGSATRVEVGREQYTVLNSTTLQLTERLTTRAKYQYFCRLRHSVTPTLAICNNNVNIGDPPLPVQDFRCILQNWKDANCSWREPFNAVRTIYKTEYRTMSEIVDYRKPCNTSKVFSPLGADHTRHVSCVVSEAHVRLSHEAFRMEVTASNALGRNSTEFVLNTYEIVRPAAPVHVWGNNVTASSVRLQAEIGLPMASFPKPIAFGVEFTSRWNPTPQPVDASAMLFRHDSSKHKGRNTTNETLVSGLLPNTEYRFSVRMRSSVADVARHPDLWSATRETLVRTLSTVPTASPVTALGSFELVGRATSRTVYVYWRQIDPQQENGDGFGYCAVLRRPGRGVVHPDSTTAAYALFKDLGLGRHEFSVTACNAVGKSAEPATLVVPDQENLVPRPHPITLVADASGNYTLAWEQKADTPVDNYTLFWCQHTRDRPFQCEGQLDWMVVDGQQRNHSLQLPSSAEYQFAVAANHGGASSGMVWSRCLLLANYGERIQELDSVYVQVRGATELTLAWNDYCSPLATAHFSYKVYYCVSQEGQCLPGEAGRERSVQLSAGERDRSVRVPGLLPYTEYRLQVAVLSGDAEGQRSPPVVNRTAAARPEPPTITRVINRNTSLVVFWAAPSRPNGPLDSYQLTVAGPLDSYQLTVAGRPAIPMSPDLKTYTVTDLLPYSEYAVQVVACNKVDCSEPSPAERKRTLPGRPGPMEPPRSQLLNASTVRVSWRRPAQPGGPEPRYTLQIVSERAGENTTSSQELPHTVAQDGRLVAELRVPECEPGSSQRHLFAIRASVPMSDGPPADGPWSELTQQQCVLVSDWPTATIVGVVVGGAVLMMCVVLLFFLLCHRTKRKLSEMRNLGVNMPAGLDRPEKAHGFPGGPEAGYGRLVSQNSAGTDRTAASVSGQPLLQEELTREECDGEGSELTPAVNTDSNSCSSSATNYTDSGAECEKGASSPTYSKFQWPAPVEPANPQMSPYVQAGGPEMAGAAAAAAAAAGPAPPYTKFSPYVDAKAIQALVARGRSMESLPAGEPTSDLSRSEPDLSAAAAGPPPPYSQIGHRSSTGYVSMASEDALPAAARPYTRLGSPPPAAGCAKSRPPAAGKSADLKPYVSLGPPPPPASAAGFPPYVLAGPPPGEGPAPVSGCSPSHATAAAGVSVPAGAAADPAGAPPTWANPRLAEVHSAAAAAAARGLRPLEPVLPVASAGYVQHDKLHPHMELRDLPASTVTSGYVSQEALAAGEPVLSPKKLPTVATARDPYCRVVTSHQSPPDLGPNVSMV